MHAIHGSIESARLGSYVMKLAGPGASECKLTPSRLERDAERALTSGCEDTVMRLSMAAQTLEKLRAKQEWIP